MDDSLREETPLTPGTPGLFCKNVKKTKCVCFITAFKKGVKKDVKGRDDER
jgi:hypothetical protein